MRSIIRYSLVAVFILLLSGCASGIGDEKSSSSKMTVESYDLNDHESELISKTGIGQIEYFKLNGKLSEDEDLQLSVEVYERGKLKEEILETFDEPEKNFKDILISFGVSNFSDEERSLKLISGIPSGLATTLYPNAMTSYTFNKLVKGKIDLQKGKPAYLASWQGTTEDELSSVLNENGELPENLDETELVFLYKLVWVGKEK